MKCELAKDLIILYAEDLCSQETAEELKAHLENCPECAKRLEEYKKELEEKCRENEEQIDTIDIENLKPLKKIKKKLVRGKIRIAILCVILAFLIGGLGFLSYGQVTNDCMSFSVLADTVKIHSVCKTLAKGDTAPFMDILAYRVQDQYTVNGSKELEDFDAYIAQVETDVKNACEYYFAGKDVTVKIHGIDQYPYAEEEPTDTTNTDITIGFYEKDELLYELAFGKVSADKFIVYELAKNGEPAFTTSVLPYYDADLDICLHYATKKAYSNLTEMISDKAGAGLALAITTEGTDEEKDEYRELIMEKIQALCDAGWYYKEVMYFVDEYDVNVGKWIYKVWFMLENQNGGDVVMVEQKFHYYDHQLYTMEDSPAVIIAMDESIPVDIEEQVLKIFE